MICLDYNMFSYQQSSITQVFVDVESKHLIAWLIIDNTLKDVTVQ